MTLYRADPQKGWAWVTGASSGLGKHTALQLAKAGYDVAVTARRSEALEALAQSAMGEKGNIIPFPADVCDPAAVSQIVAELTSQKPISLALLNAGIFLPTTPERWSQDLFRRTFDVNVLGVSNSIVPLLEPMRKAKGGHIAIVGSVAGYGGLPTSAAYGASKAALLHMASALSYDFTPDNIRIQVISPGFIDTPATKQNAFPMPFILDVETAAERMMTALQSDAFEVSFPRRFSWMLKAINMLPYGAYHALVRRMTRWDSSRL